MEIVDIRDFPRRAPQTPEMEESASHHLMQKLKYSGRCSEVPGSMYESLEKMTPGAKEYSQIKTFTTYVHNFDNWFKAPVLPYESYDYEWIFA